jgi:hypothetical protein
MFMQTVMQIVGRITALFSQAYVWTKTQLSTPVSNLLARFTRISQNVRNLHLLNLLRVQTGLNTNRLIVNLITAEQSIKAALIYVQAKLTRLGQLLQTIVLPTRQPVLLLVQQTKDKLAALIKSARSCLSVTGSVLTPMVLQLIQTGTKFLEIAKQLRQRVLQVFKKDK